MDTKIKIGDKVVLITTLGTAGGKPWRKRHVYTVEAVDGARVKVAGCDGWIDNALFASGGAP